MHGRRSEHSATPLRDGRVLIAGGDLDGPPTAEIYDPASDTWTAVAGLPPSLGRTFAMASLPDGDVLLLGGWSPTVARFESRSSTIVPAMPLPVSIAKQNPRAVGLPDGQVLAVTARAAARYDPLADCWVATAAKQTGGFILVAVLNDGCVFATGGIAPTEFDVPRPTGDAEIYDPAQDRWSAMMSTAVHTFGTATALHDGRVLLVGGQPDARAVDVFDVAGDSWGGRASLREGRKSHQTVRLSDGSVLVLGGTGRDSLRSVERYDPVGNAWQSLGDLLLARVAHTATLLPDGRVLVVGGATGDEAAQSGELYQVCL